MYTAYILNRLPSKAIDNEVPARRANIEVDYTKIKIFGCEALLKNTSEINSMPRPRK